MYYKLDDYFQELVEVGDGLDELDLVNSIHTPDELFFSLKRFESRHSAWINENGTIGNDASLEFEMYHNLRVMVALSEPCVRESYQETNDLDLRARFSVCAFYDKNSR